MGDELRERFRTPALQTRTTTASLRGRGGDRRGPHTVKPDVLFSGRYPVRKRERALLESNGQLASAPGRCGVRVSPARTPPGATNYSSIQVGRGINSLGHSR